MGGIDIRLTEKLGNKKKTERKKSMNTTLSKPKSVEKFVKYETEEPRSSTSLPKLSQSLLIPENILKIVTSKNKSISTKLSNTKNSRRDLSRTCTAASKKTSKTPKKGKEGDSGRVMFKNFLKNVKGNSCRKVINNSCSQKKQNSCNGGKFKRFRFKEKEKINQENSKKLREQRLIDFRAERLEKIKQRNLSNHSELKLKKFKQFKNIFGGKYKKKKKIAIRSANCSSSPSKPLMYFQKFKEAQRKRSKVMKQNFKFFKNSKNSKKSKKNQKWKNLISSKNYNKKTRLVCSRKSSKKKLLGLSSDKLNQTMSFFHNKKDPKKFEKFNKTETKFYPNTSNRSINRSGSRKNDILWKIRMKKKSVKASEGSKESIVKKLNFNRKNLLSNHNPFLMYKKASLDIGDMNKSLVSTTKKMKKSSRKDVLKHIQKERRNSKSEFLNLMKIQQKKQRSFDFKNHFTGQKKGRKTSYAGSYDHVGHSNSQIEKEEDLKKSRFLRKKGISTATNYNSIQYKKKKLLDTEYSGKKYKYFKKILTSPDDPESDEDHDDDLYRSLMLEGKNRESVLTRMDYTNFLSESIIVHNNNDAFEKIKKKFLFKGRRYYLDDLKDFLMGNKDDWMSKEDFGYFKSVYFEHFKQGFNALRQHRVPKHRQKYEGILDLNIELHPCSIKYLPKCKQKFNFVSEG